MKPLPVVLTIQGRDYEVPAAMAADWLLVLMQDPIELDDMVSTMVTDGEELLFDEAVGMELYDACLEVISHVSGRPWWQAMRLIAVATQNWNTVGAEMMYRGFLAQQVSLSAWLDVLLLVILKMIDPKEANMFLLRLEDPPKELDDGAEATEPEMDRNAFLALGQ